ncbi:molybdopterin-containing oxidoreductase family protein [Antrihabitans spumae]|uniref:Molybdopterin-dependent oxidoreductase n=1 Tax=Antrihabitans spumae TaxID=3373370 RepID=A0ABW7JXQ6_9NOCA
MPTEVVTYCRICEPLCGLIATVEDGRLVKLRPDKEHPLSQGNACPKGIAFAEVQNDPDLVLHPLRRGADGEFERVTWEQAYDDIGARLKAVIDTHGRDGLGWYFGNPSSFSYSHTLWILAFVVGSGMRHLYSAGSQDVNNRFVASQLLYGSLTATPIPDLDRTDFLFMVGANPLVSHGSVMTAPRIKDKLRAIVDRGGRVVVVDPRRSETAKAFEHLPIRPDGDAWLLASMLQVLFAEGRTDSTAIAAQSVGADRLRAAVARFTPEHTQAITGIAPDQLRAMARELASARRAAIYGRTGTCLGRQGTLVAFLLDALALVTGNLDSEGGGVFGEEAFLGLDFVQRTGMIGYDRRRSRIGNFPDVLGSFPAAVMAKEITTPGKGRLRALFTSAGNPVLSVPNGDELEAALTELELFVSIDLYVNDTNRKADYILPATTFLERDDVPLPFGALSTTPFIQATERVVEPYGEAREEWEIIDEIAKRIGVVPFIATPKRVGAALSGLIRRVPGSSAATTPKALIDVALRLGAYGDRFGLRRGGLSMKKLRANPHGIVLRDHVETGVLKRVVKHTGGRVRLAPDEIIETLASLGDRREDPDFPLRLIGLRELKSHNSWMHNSEFLMRGNRAHTARVNPVDAEAAGIEDGKPFRIASAHGSIELPAFLTDEVGPGTIAVPHGWGHRGGWQVANAAGGVNVNLLMSTAVEDIEPLAGMAHLNGVPVRIEPVA